MLANAWFPLCVSLPTCSVWGAVHLTITASPRTKLDLKFTPIVMCHTNTKQARGKKSLLLPIQQILQFIPPVYFKYNANPYLNKILFFFLGLFRISFLLILIEHIRTIIGIIANHDWHSLPLPQISCTIHTRRLESARAQLGRFLIHSNTFLCLPVRDHTML